MVKVEERCSSISPQPQNCTVMPDVGPGGHFYVPNYQFNDKDQQLRQIIKGVVKKSAFDEADLAGPAAERDIHEFMDRYVDTNWRVRVDIPVKDLRKMIPLLIMYVYNMREERSHRKVKGMWTVKPADWPEEVPYCDPNNQTRPGLGKPKKDILMKMFMFLLRKYKDAKPPARSPSSPSSVSYVSISPISESDSYGANGTEYQVIENQTPYETPAPAEQYVERMETEPSTVVTMEMQEWDPSRDIMQRIQEKVHYLINTNMVPPGDVGLLSIIRDLFCKMYDVHQNAVQFFLTSAHEFECTLDLVHHFHEMTEKDRLKWKDFEEKAAKCEEPKVDAPALNSDARPSSVPNFIQNDSEENFIEVIQLNQDGVTLSASMNEKDGITLCHIDDLQGLENDFQIVIKENAPIQKHLEDDKMTKGTIHEESDTNETEKEVLTQSAEEQNGQYFVVGGEAVISMTDQNVTANIDDELLHNHKNSSVSNSDMICIIQIPCENEVEIETSGRVGESETASESVGLTADILSTSLAIVAQNHEDKEPNCWEMENLHNSNVNSASRDLVNIPNSRCLHISEDQQEVDVTIPDQSAPVGSAATSDGNSIVDIISQNSTGNSSETQLARVNLALIPSNNQNITVPLPANLLARDLKTSQRLKRALTTKASNNRPGIQTETAMYPNQLNRPPEGSDPENEGLNTQSGRQGCSGQIAGTVQPPDISSLHIVDPEQTSSAKANVMVESGPRRASKVKQKTKLGKGPPGKDPGPLRISTRSITNFKQKKVVSEGIKKLLGECLSKRMPGGKSSVALASEAHHSKAFSEACKSLVPPVETTLEPSPSVVNETPDVPASDVPEETANSTGHKSPSAPEQLDCQQQEEGLESGGNAPSTENENSSIDKEEMIPTVVEEMENEKPEEPPPKRKKFRTKK